MPQLRFKVKKLDRAQLKIRAVGKVLQRPLAEIVVSEARLTAISFSKSSQPFGTGAEARDAGRKAVARDIARVYATPGRAYESISSKHWRVLFWKAYKAGEYDVARAILRQYGESALRSAAFDAFDGGALHKAARSLSSGRVYSTKAKLIVTNPRQLAAYVSKRQDNVGFSKGVWADVARQLGSIRGLRSRLPGGTPDITANWITRQAVGIGRVNFDYSTSSNPRVTITSPIPWASRILTPAAMNTALAIARGRMLKQLEIAVHHETRSLRRAA